MDNHELIQQLEQLTNVRLKLLDTIFMPLKGYTIKNGIIDGIALCNSNITDLTDIVKILKKFEGLKTLYLSMNNISDISPIKELVNLNKLDLRENKITDLTPISKLTILNKLYLKKNLISNILPIKHLNQLERLNLQYNKIEKIPEWITKFDKMEINIDKNKLGISLYKNPISYPPPEIIKQGKNTIKSWFNANKQRLNEVKIIIVGDAKSGKTSLINRLQHNSYNEYENQTDGISITNLNFKNLDSFKNQTKLHGINATFWDFGGQEILFSTHLFFLSKRSVYILLFEARRDSDSENQLESWLNRIKTYAGNSPIIIVVNKIDLNPAFSIDEFSIKEKYKNIEKFIYISCKNNENIELLKNELETIIPKSELFDTEIDEKWITLKEIIKKTTGDKNFITHFELKKLCLEQGLENKEEQKSFVNFLHDLGVILHFEDLNLSEYFVTDPSWVTNGVYKILTSNISANKKGEIETNLIDTIINQETKPNNNKIIEYSPNEVTYITDIMVLFKLAFYSNNREKIFIPDLFEKNHPNKDYDSIKESKNKITLIYNYDYLISSVIPRLIVELRKDIKTIWRRGFILESKSNFNTKALIYSKDNKIHISVLGDIKQKREYLSVIRYFLDAINEELELNPTILIPLPDLPEEYVKLNILNNMEKEGERIYKNWELKKEYNIAMLLDGIDSEEYINSFYKNSNINIVYENNPIQLLQEVISNTKLILKRQEEIANQINFNIQHLMHYPQNQSNTKEIEQVIKQLTEQNSNTIISEIIKFINKSISKLNSEINDKIQEIIPLILGTEDWDTKVKLSVPLLNLVGVNIEHEFSIKKHIKQLLK